MTRVDRLQCGISPNTWTEGRQGYSVGFRRTRGQKVTEVQCGISPNTWTEGDRGTVWDFAGHVDRQRVTQVGRLQLGETRGQRVTQVDRLQLGETRGQRVTQVDRLQLGKTHGHTESDTGRQITVWRDTWIDRE